MFTICWVKKIDLKWETLNWVSLEKDWYTRMHISEPLFPHYKMEMVIIVLTT